MKKFIGEVIISNKQFLLLFNRKRTWVYIYFENESILFEKGKQVLVQSKKDFPITVTHWTNEHGKLITDRVHGRYYMYSNGLEIKEVKNA